jgi:diguanylate cyclase (GGDEF)-like protein
LKEFAKRLQKAAESGMPVSRFAGDQFAIVVPAAEFEAVVRKVDSLLRALTETYELDSDGLRCTIGVSVGIETVVNAHHSTSVLVRNADMALQVARNQPGNSRYRWFSQVEGDVLASLEPAALRQSA